MVLGVLFTRLWKFRTGGRLILRPTINLRSGLRFLLDDDASAGWPVTTMLLPDGLHLGVNVSFVWGNAIMTESREIMHHPNCICVYIYVDYAVM